VGGVSRALVGLGFCLAAEAVVAACVDLDALTGGTPPADASMPTLDAALDAHTSDGRISDARPKMDQESDAQPPADGGSDAPTDAPSPPCPGYPDAIVCDDFDDGPIGPPWTESVARGSLSLSKAQSWTAPTSLFSEIYSEAGTSGEGTASLVFQIPHAIGKIRNTFDVYFDQIGQRSAALGSVYANDGLLNYEVAIFARGGGGELDLFEDGTLADGGELSVTHKFYPTVPLQMWMRLIMDIDFDAPATVTITLESPPGTPATPFPAIPITPTNKVVTMSVIAGIEFVVDPETIGWRTYVDDVLVEAL
jgi:hypothetical protein